MSGFTQSPLVVRSETVLSCQWTDLLAKVANRTIFEKNVKNWVKQCDQLNFAELAKQYEKIPAKVTKEEATSFRKPENNLRNRYSAIECIEYSRVVLSFPPSVALTDYIHANRVTSKATKTTFVLSQGPLEETVFDFWRMIWQEGTRSMVMLCDYVEGGASKCQQYFPSGHNATKNFGGLLSVKTKKIEENTKDRCIITELELEYNSEIRKIKQYQFKAWPDHEAPSSASIDALFEILRAVRQDEKPIVIHCSAGIGRTGTFVALELCLAELIGGNALSVPKVIQELRAQRAYSVQSFEQYTFLHEAIVKFAFDNALAGQETLDRIKKICDEAHDGGTRNSFDGRLTVSHAPTMPTFHHEPLLVRSETMLVSRWNEVLAQVADVEKLKENVKEWAARVNSMSAKKLTDEYRKIPDDVQPGDATASTLPENEQKNRYMGQLCLDRTRVKLTFPSTRMNSYINANFVRYRNLKNSFIVTQGPITRTLYDFWRMVWQEAVSSIVMLCEYVEEDYQMCQPYFSEKRGKTKEFGERQKIAVKTIKIDENPSAGLRTTELEVVHDGQLRKITQFHFMNWPDFDSPTTGSITTVFDILKNIRNESNPVVVHCSAGIGRSGTFVAIEMCLMELIFGKRLDVSAVVLALRQQRALAVQSSRQYRFIHQCILEFAAENNYIQCEITDKFNNN